MTCKYKDQPQKILFGNTTTNHIKSIWWELKSQEIYIKGLEETLLKKYK